jgi:adenosylcobinamide kinase / adenosylcobinamide-phosphate guanylyltransferase
VSLTFLVGGARSGKSALAVELARSSGRPVSVIATAEPGDEEMSERIRRHRRERPAAWDTIEQPLELEQAIHAVDHSRTLIVDCLTLWVANLIARGDADVDVEAQSIRAAEAANARAALTIVISNEVGLGIVPANDVARRFRDLLGSVNAAWAATADEAGFVVAGRMLRLT